MKPWKLISLPSDKDKEFCVISLNTYNQLALDHLKDSSIYLEVIGIQSTQVENLISNAWTDICKRRDMPNRYKNNFITRNNKLTSFCHLIKTHKRDTTLQIRPIISSLEGSLHKISWLLVQILKPLLLTFPGHVKNPHEVIHRLTQVNTDQLKQNNYTFSFNVISLDTTRPAHPTIYIISEHIISKNLYCHKLTATDIHQLLSIYSRQYLLYYLRKYRLTNIRTTHWFQYIIYGSTRTSSTIHLPLIHILHKMYRRYTYVDIIQRKSYCHI